MERTWKGASSTFRRRVASFALDTGIGCKVGGFMLVTGGSVLVGREMVDADIVVRDGVIDAVVRRTSVEPRSGSDGAAGGAQPGNGGSADEEVMDASGLIVAPGLIDLHFHGCAGYDFCDAAAEALHAIAAYEASRGVTAICPATMTYPEDFLDDVMSQAAAFEPATLESALVGINMEGPFISPDRIGAQNPAYVQRCDADMVRRLQHASRGLVKLVDVAPEEPGALEFVREMAGDVRISLAHTCAGYECATMAFEAGARHVTHLFNAMPPLNHRNPGPIGAAADRDDVTCELIADGVHVHPAMVRLAFDLFGADRIVLISDSMRACGMGDGVFDLGGQDVYVEGAKAALADGTIAGSVTDLATCLRIAVCEMGIPLVDALVAAAENPARALGIAAERGSVEVGKIADLVLLDGDLQVRGVLVRGVPMDARPS